ncbi:5-amino-6-(5-phospho-D-ribitylamino)uracil phosphatase YigB [Photobacterium angustum]|uniref:5-amino-6-(5-phospho-D-ribitylamino)uracil phosphatase YigB n=1 Tax=Photobacterium angustum TaxID=661 RepID=UPI0005DBD51E|nr:5-amino-6-(5-phospho-D-ribitylamino)uracil phosphatase YigB [Photobacterium angustum]KJG28541.1 2-haloalkanoic acid dehalogenase [Photobacterium angustum]PSW87661.1 5-amino-6-(5-phospho-D-ribitylamino)uracil phosphatase YigB [Photobacterium angustum]
MHFYRQLTPISALTFDLDDTLYDNRPVIVRAEQAMFDWLTQILPSRIMIDKTVWSSLKSQLAMLDPMLKHDVSLWRYETIKIGLMQLGFRLSEAEILAQQGLDTVLAVRNHVDVPAETHRVLKQLSDHFPLVGLTNGNVDAEKIGLAPYFVEVFQAGKDGLAKPEADLFNLAVNTLNLPAATILHVGDHLITDVKGAKQHGFQACWFNDQQKLIQQQSKALILPDVEITQLAQLLEIVGLEN